MSARPRAFVAWIRVALAILGRPRLWLTAMRQVHRLARRGWWHRPPFLPLPGRAYLGFRSETQYGDESHPPVPADVLNYLAWCQEMGRLG